MSRKPLTARTFHPLPFENLEPKRFEDLARQLAYDFKPWRQLEATGRTGSDDGFDARGFEIVQGDNSSPPQDDTDDITDEGATDRLWLIQCKREKVIRPAKMREHLAAIPPESRTDLYGLIFVAASDFSKATRDVLRAWCSEHGIAECHVWGKAELEDLLYQPKNDNLLFAYFGISLQIRRQKEAVNLRRMTTVKRKLKRLLEKNETSGVVILRDPTDDRYPSTNGVSFKEGGFKWRSVQIKGLGLHGLRILGRQHYAYYCRETESFDVATGYNLAIPREWDNPWYIREVSKEEINIETKIHEFWVSIPKTNQFHAEYYCDLAYEDIIEIDEVGNDDIRYPVIYAHFNNEDGQFPVMHNLTPQIVGDYGETIPLNGSAKHVRVYPDHLRNNAFDERWQDMEEFKFSEDRREVELTPPQWVIDRRAMETARTTAPEDDAPGG